MLADAEPLGNLRYAIAPLRNLGHRITLELIAEISIPHRRRLSSKLGFKASRNLGAIHVAKVGTYVRGHRQWHRFEVVN